MKQYPFELETKYNFEDQNKTFVEDLFFKVEAFGRFTLSKLSFVHLFDQYFDNTNFDLYKKGTLRVRIVNEKTKLMTFKTRGQEIGNENNTSIRTEIEDVVSLTFVKEIYSVIKRCY